MKNRPSAISVAAKAGDGAAKEALLAGNVSLLKSIVRRYLGKGVEFDDLFQLAGMGLLKAVYGFDERFPASAFHLCGADDRRGDQKVHALTTVPSKFRGR